MELFLLCWYLGAIVNPIQKGVDVIYESEIIKAVQNINQKEAGKWIVEGTGFPMPNYILMAGVPVINSTNTYPDMDKWHLIDTEKKQEEVYNRYAHINVSLVKDENIQEKFTLVQADLFEVKLSSKDLKTLDVKYIFTVNELEGFEKLYEYEQYKIFKVN